MKSHTVQLNPRDLIPLVAGPVFVAAMCAVLLHFAAQVGVLPAPRPTLDTDQTILIHQADAARTAGPTEILLLGDSSCLMDVSARQLSESLNRTVLNLGTLSYLDLHAQSLLLQEFTQRHPPKAVVLLMHPEALRRLGSETHHLGILTNYLAGRDHVSHATSHGRFNHYAGVTIASGRVLARVVPSPLRGVYGAYYGFAPDLEHHMAQQHGSAVDPGRESIPGSAEYRLAPTLQQASRAFRAALPQGTKLIVGMTPVATTQAGAGFPAQRDALLREWAGWLTADAVLIDLPATLLDEEFARSTHLKPSAVPGYSTRLASALAPLFP